MQQQEQQHVVVVPMLLQQHQWYGSFFENAKDHRRKAAGPTHDALQILQQCQGYSKTDAIRNGNRRKKMRKK